MNRTGTPLPGGVPFQYMMLTYQQALDFIFDYVDYEKQVRFTYDAETLDLTRVERLLSLLGRPQNRFHSIHIAGTKGKGSTAAMSESILRAAGYRTGLYTSPHLHTFRERIRVGGKLLTRDQLVDLVERCGPAIQQIEDITTFEIITALGFLYFAEQGVEWAVLETGLGGRLDATNVVLPEITAITSLSLDHTYLLGDTIEKIAREKAGIIKPNVPLVCAPQVAEAMSVITAVCAKQHSPLIRVGHDWTWQAVAGSAEGQLFNILEMKSDDIAARYDGLQIPLLGQHQLVNATIAVALIMTLRRLGVTIPDHALHSGLASTRWPGRLETLQRRPWIMVDGAHNPDSVARLAAALQQWFPRQRTAIVFGSSQDKNSAGMLQTLVPLSDLLIMTKSRHPRAADPHRLARQAVPLLGPGQLLTVSNSVAEGLDVARSWARSTDLICGTGSLFVVGELREALANDLPIDDWAREAEPAEAAH